MCISWQFSVLAQKIYFIHFFQSGQNIMSLLKRNIQIPSPRLWLFCKKCKNWAKKMQKLGPQTPLTPPNPFFWLAGMCFNLPMPKKTITLLYGANLRCFVAIIFLSTYQPDLDYGCGTCLTKNPIFEGVSKVGFGRQGYCCTQGTLYFDINMKIPEHVPNTYPRKICLG